VAGTGHCLLERAWLALDVDAERAAPVDVSEPDDTDTVTLEPEHGIGVETGQFGGDQGRGGSVGRDGQQLGDIDASTNELHRSRGLDLA
jgi:hypothetical protein